MLESLFSLSSPRVYLLGFVLMALRMLWKTRLRRCACCDESVRACVVRVNDQTYDLRYFLVLLFGIFWPIAVAIMIASRVYGFFFRSDDDAPA